MHKILAGSLALLSILSALLIGIWMCQTNVFLGLGIYSFITVGALLISGGFSIA